MRWKGKNVRMLNFACLAASLLLTAGVGAGYVSTPSRHYAPQLVDGITYYGGDLETLNPYGLPADNLEENLMSLHHVFRFGSLSYTLNVSETSSYSLLSIDYDTSNDEFSYSVGTWTSSDLPLNIYYGPWNESILNIDLSLLSYAFDGSSYRWNISFFDMDLRSFVSPNAVVDGNFVYVPSYDGTDVTDAITDGLGGIVPMGGALVTGFDAIALDDGALTPVVTFGFVLMGLGISVGIVKKCFNWVTGRHGM